MTSVKTTSVLAVSTAALSSMIAMANDTSNAVAAPFGDVPTEADDRLLLALVLLLPFVALPLLLASCFGFQLVLDRLLPNRGETKEEFDSKIARPWRLRIKVWLSVTNSGRQWFYLQIIASIFACVMLVYDFYHIGPRTTWMVAVEVRGARSAVFPVVGFPSTPLSADCIFSIVCNRLFLAHVRFAQSFLVSDKQANPHRPS
jgi:hypothetical protein